VPESRHEVVTFVDSHLERQIDEYSRVLSEATFGEVYFGGGTPTMLPADLMERVFRRIPRFRDIRLKATEASPRTITDEHVDLLSSWGFGYVSIGVQTLDQNVLQSVNREATDYRRLARVIAALDSARIVSNVDLIFFLKTGTLDDLSQARDDLRRVMRELRPASITIHSEYNARKSREKQLGLLRLVREELDRSAEYVCTNSRLADEDADDDMRQAAEYRLMRTCHRDFSFYLSGKVPLALRFGYNVLGLGEYEIFTVRSNYLYVSDYFPKHSFGDVLISARAVEADLARVRGAIGLRHRTLTDLDRFFTSDAASRAFAETVRAEGLPALPADASQPVMDRDAATT
jgi:hypothetical protein